MMPQVGRAASVWNDEERAQAMGLAQYFRAYGFFVVRNLLTAAECTECIEEVGRVAARHREFENVRVIGTRNPLEPSYDLEDASAEHPVIRKITGISKLSSSLEHKLVRNEKVIGFLHELLGTRVELYRDALMMKPAGVGQEKPWHQDAVYWPWRPMSLVSTMIAMDDATRENGCLQVVPGSHREVAEHFKVNWELQMTLSAEQQEQTQYVELRAGDCLLFHSLLLHASEANASTRARRAAIVSYSPGGLDNVSPHKEETVLLSRTERNYENADGRQSDM